MFSVLRIISLVLFLIGDSANALDMLTFKKLLTEKGISSIEGALAVLPENLRSKYTIAFNSRSLHGTSMTQPRVILFGDDAKFVITFNGSAEQKAYEFFEIMEWVDAKKEFQFFEVNFPTSGLVSETWHVSEPNPPKCLKCHTTNPRPIWDSFPLWPGFYGEAYLQPLGVTEREGLEGFLRIQPTHPRYKYLLRTDVFKNADTFYPSTKARYDSGEKDPPNSVLGSLLSGLNLQKIVKEISNDKRFMPFQYALLGAVSHECTDFLELFPNQFHKNLAQEFEKFSARLNEISRKQDEYKCQRKLPYDEGKYNGEKFRLPKNTFYRALFILEKLMGMDITGYTLALEKNTYDFDDGHIPLGAVERNLISFVKLNDEKIEALFSSMHASTEKKYCNYLQKTSRNKIEEFQKISGSDLFATEENSTLIRNKSDHPAQLNLCISCHESGVGPKILFSRSDDLKSQLAEKKYARGTLLDEIKFRLSPAAGASRMPLGLNISNEEASSLIKYFESR